MKQTQLNLTAISKRAKRVKGDPYETEYAEDGVSDECLILIGEDVPSLIKEVRRLRRDLRNAWLRSNPGESHER